MSFTVVPLHNLDLGTGTRIPFGTKFVLQDVPQWLKDDTRFLGDLSRHDPGSPSPPRWGARNFHYEIPFRIRNLAIIDWVGSRLQLATAYSRLKSCLAEERICGRVRASQRLLSFTKR